MDKFWPICLNRFEQELSAQQFNTWIKPLKIEVVQKDGENHILRLLAPNKFVLQWVKDRFLNKIQSIASEILNQSVQIEIAIGKQLDAAIPETTSTVKEKKRLLSVCKILNCQNT